jgi:hypothetical protein
MRAGKNVSLMLFISVKFEICVFLYVSKLTKYNQLWS